jgi:hypothetical protein
MLDEVQMFTIVTEDEKIAISYLGIKSYDICAFSSQQKRIWKNKNEVREAFIKLRQLNPVGCATLKIKELK